MLVIGHFKDPLDLRILVTGGRTKEIIDGVRHYENLARPEDQGHRVAAALASSGARVTLVTAKTKLPAPLGVIVQSVNASTGKPLISAQDLLEASVALCLASEFDLILHVAVFSSLKPATLAADKLKVKGGADGSLVWEAQGCLDALAQLRGTGVECAGYDRRQVFQGLELQGYYGSVVKAQRHDGRVVTSIPLGARGARTTDLAGRKVIVSSGPIPQQLTTTGDVLSNFSSGLQGHEIACALADRGAQVVLITGPVTLADPAHPGVTTRHVTHVEALLSACLAELPADAYVGTAAVADFKVSALMAPPAPGSSLALPLLQTVDILNTLGHLKDLRPQVVVGFAAETRELLTYARDKLNRKGADVIFANSVGERPASTPSTHNRVYRVTAGETQDLGVQEKYQVGQAVADFIRDALEAPSVVSCASE